MGCPGGKLPQHGKYTDGKWFTIILHCRISLLLSVLFQQSYKSLVNLVITGGYRRSKTTIACNQALRPPLTC